jgi:hypothetical protein
MAVLLNKAIMPNLVQTIEYTPALIHADRLPTSLTERIAFLRTESL